jgi:hypothetical protein
LPQSAPQNGTGDSGINTRRHSRPRHQLIPGVTQFRRFGKTQNVYRVARGVKSRDQLADMH